MFSLSGQKSKSWSKVRILHLKCKVHTKLIEIQRRMFCLVTHDRGMLKMIETPLEWFSLQSSLSEYMSILSRSSVSLQISTHTSDWIGVLWDLSILPRIVFVKMNPWWKIILISILYNYHNSPDRTVTCTCLSTKSSFPLYTLTVP